MANVLLRSLHNLETSMSEPTAKWDVPLNDGNHVVEFEHGTATGRRVVRVDGKELVHRDWMFRLVGDEVFTHRNTRFVIRVDPIPGLKYSYTLWVNGKPYKSFVQAQSKILCSWLAKVGNNEYRIVLGEDEFVEAGKLQFSLPDYYLCVDKQAQSVCVNGEQVEVENEFTDDGAEMLFAVDGLPAAIRSCSSGQKKIGIIYILYINGVEIQPEGTDTPAEDSQQ